MQQNILDVKRAAKYKDNLSSGNCRKSILELGPIQWRSRVL